jgi:cytochrome c
MNQGLHLPCQAFFADPLAAIADACDHDLQIGFLPRRRLPIEEETLRIQRVIMVVVLVGISSASPVSAQMRLADSKRGQELAARLCSGCHIVASGSATTTNVDVPTFAAIAARPDTTAERLAGRIIIPHPPMPTIQLTVAEMRDIIAYILTLKP